MAGYLWLLSRLYETIIPVAVLDEVRFYKNLPDSVEIARATRTWLRSMGLERGEAEALALYEETRADAVLLTDEDAMQKASCLGATPIDLSDVGRDAYHSGILTAQGLLEYANKFLEQGILVTRYMENLREDSRRWLSKQM